MVCKMSEYFLWLLIFQYFVIFSESKPSSRRGDSSILAGASLIGTSVTSLSGEGPSRNVVIQITNHLNTSLFGGNYFLQWGSNRFPPPSVISSHAREATQFEKVEYTPKGTVGMISYTVDDDEDPISFLIIFSVPFNYIHSSNWFGIAFVANGSDMNRSLYMELYNDLAWQNPELSKRFGYAHEGKVIAIFHESYIISATMSNSGRSVLNVDIQKREGGYEANHYKFSGK